jgi:holo-ACP synthase
MDKKLQEVLNAREKRARQQFELVKKYHLPLLSITLNIPGVIKDSRPIRFIFRECLKLIKFDIKKDKNRKIIHDSMNYFADGPQSFLIVRNISATGLKRIAVEIEDNHTIGRLFDIDVIDRNYHKISRKELNKPLRKCIICEDLAINCITLRKHPREEIINKTHKMINEFIGLNKTMING